MLQFPLTTTRGKNADRPRRTRASAASTVVSAIAARSLRSTANCTARSMVNGAFWAVRSGDTSRAMRKPRGRFTAAIRTRPSGFLCRPKSTNRGDYVEGCGNGRIAFSGDLHRLAQCARGRLRAVDGHSDRLLRLRRNAIRVSVVEPAAE